MGSAVVDRALAGAEEDAVTIDILQLDPQRSLLLEGCRWVSKCFDAGDVLFGEQHVRILAAGGAADGPAGIHGHLGIE